MEMEKTNIPEENKHKKAIIYNIKSLFRVTKKFLIEILSIREGTDIEGTINGIKKDMVFRGVSVWILVASIFIASIGLNVNSIPVIIGAMLISPLMGPILGIGLSVGTNDWDTLLRSLKNFGIAIAISLITSIIYFLITPLKDASPELLARTKPTILDVLIAIFGGVAGIVAGSRREKSNVIPGVAIATALMPPLCTAGYGIATTQYSFFFGAFYLFFINSVFIALSTLIIVRYLHFPKHTYVNKQKERQFKRYITIFVIIVILPSANIFINVMQETRFYTTAKNFMKKEFNFDKTEIINQKFNYSDTLSTIDLYLIGEKLPDYVIQDLNKKLDDYGLIAHGNYIRRNFFSITDSTALRVHQNPNERDSSIYTKIDYLTNNLSRDIRTGILEDIYKKNEEIIKYKDARIEFLENELINLKKDTIPIYLLSKEIKIQFPKIIKFAYAKSIESNLEGNIDTIPSFIVKWNNYAWRAQRKEQKQILEKWLKVRLQLDTIQVIEIR